MPDNTDCDDLNANIAPVIFDDPNLQFILSPMEEQVMAYHLTTHQVKPTSILS